MWCALSCTRGRSRASAGAYANLPGTVVLILVVVIVVVVLLLRGFAVVIVGDGDNRAMIRKVK
jgi:hypothetical protein